VGLKKFFLNENILDRSVVQENGGYDLGKGKIVEILLKKNNFKAENVCFVDDLKDVFENMPCKYVHVKD